MRDNAYEESLHERLVPSKRDRDDMLIEEGETREMVPDGDEVMDEAQTTR